ncbi:GNAT family N-acetyltransferase [Duganella violaceipulchra]|uniref:GNAT family N-acetyltransferase n=1 Tax=Duganella violaceipulchra TaxID=2849652 RepID=A0AA41L6D9_9BURK|nr:GNAT family N-acetyltransferase [Duganella violaceicalia]MBV6325179.1 GNAT family N-acetyltransferase [Duganella violaceicalia]MCP2011605.1 GNAT superfamily N-acetyltransferase [Duganella violaceicalia]
MERNDLLDHIFWHTLTGAHARHADGGGGARRYTQGFSPIVAFADPARPDFAALAAVCDPGEPFYCDSWNGAAPPGWKIDAESTMFRMVWRGAMPAADPAPDAQALGPRHAAQALELALLCKPGPFGLRTIELGDYFGCFDGERLMAMAGERLRAPGLCEISGVCTHPDYQGRGLAKKLILKLVRRHLQRGDTSFLHVMRSNDAHQLYLRMGFEDYLESVVRVISREES